MGHEGDDSRIRQALHLFDLPNEILVSILTSFKTKHLLPLTLVCHKFHNIVLRILHFRLLLAASAPEYKIILEAFLPSRRYTRPDLYCTYLGTDGLSSSTEGKGSLYEDLELQQGKDKVGGKLAKLMGLYSRFRPEYPGVKGSMPLRRIAGAAPNLQSNTAGLQTDWYAAPGSGSVAPVAAENTDVTSSGQVDGTDMIASAGEGSAANVPQEIDEQQQQAAAGDGQSLPQSQPIWDNGGDGGTRKIVYRLDFDPDELFGQFCTTVALVRLGPRRGIFQSYVPIVPVKDGVMRLWRYWLEEQSAAQSRRESIAAEILQRTSTNLSSENIANDSDIRWTDTKRNVGLKFGITEISPVIESARPDEDPEEQSTSFAVEMRELVMRTTTLMLAVEESQEMQKSPDDKLNFISWIIQTVQTIDD